MRSTFYVCLIAALSFGLWELTNRPVDAPQWTGTIDGFAYSPMQSGQSPISGEYPSTAEIEADIAILAAQANSIRTYGVDGTLAQIPAIAARHGLSVTLGIPLGEDAAINREQLERLRSLVMQNSNIERVIIGNEVLLTETLTAAALGDYLAEMRELLDVPVSTAEPWHIWLQHPELIESVDYLAVHLLPFWEGVPADSSQSLIAARLNELATRFLDTPIVIGEVGWPSHGRSRGAAEASRTEAQLFLRHFLNSAEADGYDYYLMEAFDQPWKRAEEGTVGAYWGLFDAARRAKYRLDAPLIAIPEKRILAVFAAILATAGFLLLTIDAKRMRWPGMTMFATAAFVTGNTVVWIVHDYLYEYWTLTSTLTATLLFFGLLGIVLLIFVEVHEWAEANYKEPARLKPPITQRTTKRLPKISIHVPAYAEPPDLLIETLNGLTRLDYPDYEVIVVDNNTCDEALWRPVEAHCRQLGNRFRFFHVNPLPGYKAGALNFALEKTAEDVDIIAVIDSDYVVEPDWLRQLAPLFDAPNVALVQAPQDYRDQHRSAFKRMCEAEYRGFFHIGMVSRNERNAIIQHGTMTLVRADVLREVGRWGEWTVTEDAELGLRILAHGYESVYTSTSFGRGLTPDRFRDYRSQRHRWAIGAMQILRKHGAKLLGLAPSSLSAGQRFHFLAGWTAWLGDGLNVLFSLIAIAWSALMVIEPSVFLAPTTNLTGLVLAFFAFKLVKMTWLYKTRVRASMRETLSAMIAGLSVVFITGRAVIAGCISRSARFVRTPKLAARDSATGAIEVVVCEFFLALALVGLAIGVTLTAPWQTIERQLWCLLLTAFAIPNIAAIFMSLSSAAPTGKSATTVRTSTKATHTSQQPQRGLARVPARSPSRGDDQRERGRA